MADLPFMSYASESQTLENAASLMRAGAQIVSLREARGSRIRQASGRTRHSVCAHMGLTPVCQSDRRFSRSGQRYGTGSGHPRRALLQDSGANILLLECVPRRLAKTITDSLEIPVGIGAGPDTTAQIMVLHDYSASPITQNS